MLTWKMQMSITLLITHACVNFLAVAVHMWHKASQVQSSKIWVLVFEIEEYTEISAYKSQFCMCFCSHKDEQNAKLKSLEKEVIVSW